MPMKRIYTWHQKVEELMQCALKRCTGKHLFGTTDLHPGEDCAMGALDQKSPGSRQINRR